MTVEWKLSREVPVERLEVFLDGRVVVWLADGSAVEVTLDEQDIEALVNKLEEKL